MDKEPHCGNDSANSHYYILLLYPGDLVTDMGDREIRSSGRPVRIGIDVCDLIPPASHSRERNGVAMIIIRLHQPRDIKKVICQK